MCIGPSRDKHATSAMQIIRAHKQKEYTELCDIQRRAIFSGIKTYSQVLSVI